MEFRITRAGNTDKMWEEYPQIKENFKTKHIEKKKKNIFGEVFTYIENIVEISTLEDLLKLRELVKNDLVITNNYFSNDLRIIIYDDYLE